MTDLKPCPFCGEKAVRLSVVKGVFTCIQCHECRIMLHSQDSSKTEAVVEAWNKRVKE